MKKCKRLLMDNIGPHGSLNNDNFLRAILSLRNTPDPDCKISPAEVLFGRPLRDAFSFATHLNKFENPAIRPAWKEAWSQKEEAMKTRYARSMESLNQCARDLPQLKFGDRVFVQNQRGSHPTKWDTSGIIKEIGEHNKYVVKIDGTGRLTTRNRRFLRKYTPATLDISHQAPLISTPTAHAAPQPTQPPIGQNDYQSATPQPSTTEPSSCQIDLPLQPSRETTQEQIPDTTTFHDTSTTNNSEIPPTPNSATPEPRTSSRIRFPRKSYIPETGTWE